MQFTPSRISGRSSRSSCGENPQILKVGGLFLSPALMRRHALLVTTVRNATISISFSLWHIALVVVYAYHSSAQTLHEAQIKPKVPAYQQPTKLRTPTGSTSNITGTYVLQLASAIKKVHEKGQGEDVGCDEGSGYSHNRKQGFLTAREVNAGVHSLCMTQV